MSDELARAVLFGVAIGSFGMLVMIANYVERIAKALERIANRD